MKNALYQIKLWYVKTDVWTMELNVWPVVKIKEGNSRNAIDVYLSNIFIQYRT